MSSSTDIPSSRAPQPAVPERKGERHNAHELRLARTQLARDLSHRLTELFTSIVLKCDMAIMDAAAGKPMHDYLVAIKRVAMEAARINHRLEGVLRECREANR